MYRLKCWLPDKGSNLGPTDPESVALPTELSGSVLIDYHYPRSNVKIIGGEERD